MLWTEPQESVREFSLRRSVLSQNLNAVFWKTMNKMEKSNNERPKTRVVNPKLKPGYFVELFFRIFRHCLDVINVHLWHRNIQCYLTGKGIRMLCIFGWDKQVKLQLPGIFPWLANPLLPKLPLKLCCMFMWPITNMEQRYLESDLTREQRSVANTLAHFDEL